MTKFRMYDYQLGRFLSVDPLADANPQESWTPYQYGYNNPIRYNDPYGDCPKCWDYLNNAVDFASGFANAVASNNVMGAGRQSGGSSFTAGQTTGDVVSVVQGAVETVAGVVVAAGGGTATVVSVGTASPVSVPATAAGVVTAAHGVSVAGTAMNNLLNTDGQNNQGSGEGRGRNKRKPDSEATGDHTVSNDRGSTTFEKNDNNPSGFQEVKRVDKKGASHGGVDTPHVHENKKVRPANEDEIPRTDLSNNGN